MSTHDDRDRLALAQQLMVEITARLEHLTTLAAEQQRARQPSFDLVEGVATVTDLLTAYSHLMARRAAGPRS